MAIPDPLLAAISLGDVDQTRKLLREGIDPNTKVGLNLTPIHYAVTAEKVEPKVVELLLIYGADPNTKGDSGLTPLHNAAKSEDDGIVQLLLENCADPNARNDHMLTPLHIAAQGKNVSVVKLLFEFGADVEARDDQNSTPLFFSMQLDIAKLLFRVFSTGERRNQEYEAQNYPMFPITINGITLDSSIIPTAGVIETNYILVQSRIRLSPFNMPELDIIGVEILDYVSKNTYLCQWRDPLRNLDTIRQRKPVIYVGIYRKEFKIGPALERARRNDAEQHQTYEVDIIFHKSVHIESTDLVERLKQESHCNEQIEVFSDFVRLSIEGRYIDNVASIDEVFFIEVVGEAVACKDYARRTLHVQPGILSQVKHYARRTLRLDT
ncbi:ankyrin repeat-containing domain protein [Nemania sp. FL0031]|nr:ankyrin repeat-containing domain protein [Nemania sp. FL0031]